MLTHLMQTQAKLQDVERERLRLRQLVEAYAPHRSERVVAPTRSKFITAPALTKVAR